MRARYRIAVLIALLCDKQLAATILRVELERSLRRFAGEGGHQHWRIAQTLKSRGAITSSEKNQLCQTYRDLSKAIHGGRITRKKIVKGMFTTAAIYRAVVARIA